jgi:hypothetical protein
MLMAYAPVRWKDIEAIVVLLPLAENEPVSLALLTSVEAEDAPTRMDDKVNPFRLDVLFGSQ